ncbi:hypothetical protein ACLOJK_036198 [Asimina triloba]
MPRRSSGGWWPGIREVVDFALEQDGQQRRSASRPAPRPAARPAPVRNPPQPASEMDWHQCHFAEDMEPGFKTIRCERLYFGSQSSHAPPPAPVQSGGGGGMLSGIGSTIAQGMAFGTGSAVAHRAVDAVLGPRTIQHETAVGEAAAAPAPAMGSVSGSDACGIHSKAFQDCVSNFGSDISKCQFYIDMLNECRRNSGTVMGA